MIAGKRAKQPDLRFKGKKEVVSTTPVRACAFHIYFKKAFFGLPDQIQKGQIVGPSGSRALSATCRGKTATAVLPGNVRSLAFW